MKKVLFVLLSCLILMVGCATSFDSNTVEPYQEVIEVSGTSADEIYVKANQWAVSTFNNANSVIEFSDKESGTITGKYVADFNDFLGYVRATTMINIEVKEEKARITLSLIGMENLNAYKQTVMGTITDGMVKKAKASWVLLAEDLKKALASESTDW